MENSKIAILLFYFLSCPSCPSFGSQAGFTVSPVPESGTWNSASLYFCAMYFRKFLARIVISTVPAIRTTDRALITGDTPNRIMEYT